MKDDSLLELARFIGLTGLGLLIFSGIGGVLMASRTSQRWGHWAARIFRYHRWVSLFLVHPIPMLLAHRTTALRWFNVFVPFTAAKQTTVTALGTLAAYTLLVVVVTSLNIRRLKRRTWRLLHYGTYLVFVLGIIHGLLISGEYRTGETLEFDEPEKAVLLVMAGVLLAFPVWRIVAARRRRSRQALVGAGKPNV